MTPVDRYVQLLAFHHIITKDAYLYLELSISTGHLMFNDDMNIINILELCAKYNCLEIFEQYAYQIPISDIEKILDIAIYYHHVDFYEAISNKYKKGNRLYVNKLLLYNDYIDDNSIWWDVIPIDLYKLRKDI